MLGNRKATSARRHGAAALFTATAVLALAAFGAPGVRAADGNVDRRVHRPKVVSPRATSAPTGLTPAQVKQAYAFPTAATAGAGQTVAIVIPYDHPDIEADLNVFSQKFGLPACTTKNGCFTKVDGKGGKKYPTRNKLWAQETALDVEWAHAIAPGAKILLVEAKTDHLTDVLLAEDYATAHARYVSNSLGLDEFAEQASYDAHFRRRGVSIFAASGDDGSAGGVGYPASSPDVIAVGGTTLVNAGHSTVKEQAWSGSGGGCSAYETAAPAQSASPGYAAVNCAGKRAAPDVALVADPHSGVSVYDSYKTPNGWTVLGGTSASTPMWAARAADSGRVINADLLYAVPSAITFRDVTVGSNGHPAGPGYDLVTGVGSWMGATP